MTPYFESLPDQIKQRIAPRLNAMATASRTQGIPIDLLISLAVKESGGDPLVTGDKNLETTAKGLYQVRDQNFWFGGKKVDPYNPDEATLAIAPQIKKVSDECNSDAACVHFKYVAGQNLKYTPDNVQRVLNKNPHLAARMDSVATSLGGSPATQVLQLAPAVIATNPLQALDFGKAKPQPAVEFMPDYLTAMQGILSPAGYNTQSRVKSKATQDLFGM